MALLLQYVINDKISVDQAERLYEKLRSEQIPTPLTIKVVYEYVEREITRIRQEDRMAAQAR
jgi:hypothetical protein